MGATDGVPTGTVPAAKGTDTADDPSSFGVSPA